MAELNESIKKYIDLRPEVEAEINRLVEHRTFRRGELVDVKPDIRNNDLYFVEEGMARVYYLDNGRDHTLMFTTEGEFVMLSPFMVDLGASVTFIEFLETTRVAYLHPESVREAIRQSAPEMLREATPFLVSGLVSRMRHLEERVFMLQTMTARERYGWMVRRYPQVVERASLAQVASFLGLTKETLYRIRSNKYNGK